MRKLKLDNGSEAAKAVVRQAVAQGLPPDARVLELFAGTGAMYRACWCRFRGATMDIDSAKVKDAAVQREMWAVYEGNTITSMERGWLAATAFDVVDVDAAGSPWPGVRAWAISSRVRAPDTVLVLTDGYMRKRHIASPCKALLPNLPPGGKLSIDDAGYLEVARTRIREWLPAAVAVIGFDTTFDRRMAQHVVRLRCGSG